MLKKLLIIIAAILLLSMAYYAYQNWQSEQNLSAWSFVPAESVLIYETDRPLEVVKHLRSQNTWNTLSLIPEFDMINQSISHLDSVLNQENGFLQAIDKTQLLVSLNKIGQNQFDFLIVGALNQLDDRNMLSKIQQAYLKNGYTKRKRDFLGQDIIEITLNGKTAYAYTIYKQYMIGSRTPYLVEDALRLKEKEFSTGFAQQNPELSNLAKMQQDQGNLYVNLSITHNLIKELYPTLKVGQIGKSGMLDINIDDNAINLDGFFTSSSQDWLSTIGRSGSSSLGVAEVLPLNASVVQHYSFQNSRTWGETITQYLGKKQPEVIQLRKELITQLDMDVTYLYELLDDEIAIVQNQDATNTHQLLVLESNNIDMMRQYLTGVIERYINKTGDTVLNEQYRSYNIRALPTSRFTQALVGDVSSNYSNCFFTNYRNFMIFSDHLPYLKQTLEDIENENTWRKSLRKSTFIDKINQEAGYSFFVNLPASLSKLSAGLDEKWSKLIRENEFVLRSFENIAIQFTTVDNMFYTNVLIDQPEGSVLSEVVPVELKSLTLANKIIRKPDLIYDKSANEHHLITQDASHEIYWITGDFRVKWSRTLGSEIVGKIQKLDFYNNGKNQIAFCTSDSLHILDIDGNYLPDYPARLKGMDSIRHFSLVDYDGSKNYRFALADKKGDIYLTSKEASPLKGWNPKRMDNELSAPPAHYRISNRDLFLIPLSEGDIHLLNRRSNSFTGFPFKTNEFLSGDIYFNSASSFRTSTITTITENGNIQTIDLQGNVKAFDQLYKPEPETTFRLLQDVSQSSFIIVRQTENRVDFLNSNKELLFGKDYLKEDELFVQYYNINPSRQFIIIGNYNGQFIYIYDLSGRLITSRPLQGNQPISYLYQEKTDKESIYIVNDNEVSLLQIER
jgi:hypothetical protein